MRSSRRSSSWVRASSFTRSHDEQDVRLMGGLRKKLPFALRAIGTGVLSICGIPGFAGFFSKDQVIYGALAHGYAWLYALGIVTAGITAYYMCRLFFVTFFGTYRGDVDPSATRYASPRVGGNISRRATMRTTSSTHAQRRVAHDRAGCDADSIYRADRLAHVRRREFAVGAFLRTAIPASGTSCAGVERGAHDVDRLCGRAGRASRSPTCATRPRVRRPMRFHACATSRFTCRGS